MKRCRLVTAAATAAMVGILGFSAPAFAASGYGNVEVKTDSANKSITIGNDAFARTFSFKDGKLKTTLIDNKLGKTQIVPGTKSEEFLIEGMFEGTRQEPAEGALHSVKPAKGGRRLPLPRALRVGIRPRVPRSRTRSTATPPRTGQTRTRARPPIRILTSISVAMSPSLRWFIRRAMPAESTATTAPVRWTR